MTSMCSAAAGAVQCTRIGVPGSGREEAVPRVPKNPNRFHNRVSLAVNDDVVLTADDLQLVDREARALQIFTSQSCSNGADQSVHLLSRTTRSVG